ncbi:endonuclease/exonuclease/phosphatase family protein [Albibacillus kandeliae]|uniref:endonuclease/exonuclease/phosphatase family protein n=1 Tax=Albibacillus kandeliae TaxID=2174228 RepID=UPI002FCD8FFD
MRFGRAAVALLSFVTVSTPLGAQTVRIATFNAELSREGPGLMLRDIRAGDAQTAAVAEVIALARPDVIALQGIDWDLDGVALSALAEAVAERGLVLPHRFAAQPNAGLASGLDLDGDGRLGGPGDSQGYGAFTGQGGLAVLSRLPIGEVRDFSALLWAEQPGARLPVHADGMPFPSAEAQEVQRLSSTAHWVVPVMLPDGSRLDVLTFHAAPPVFDGPEDRNGLRNADEIALWGRYLNGTL